MSHIRVQVQTITHNTLGMGIILFINICSCFQQKFLLLGIFLPDLELLIAGSLESAN